MTKEFQLQKLREILLDETKPNVERVAAQRQIMKILDLKEDNNYKKEETSENGI